MLTALIGIFFFEAVLLSTVDLEQSPLIPEQKPVDAIDHTQSLRITLGDLELSQEQLMVVKSEGNYLKIWTLDNPQSYLIRETFKSFQEKIDPDIGIKVSRGSWVSFAAVHSTKRRQGKLYLVTSIDEPIPVSRSLKHEVQSRLKRRQVV